MNQRWSKYYFSPELFSAISLALKYLQTPKDNTAISVNPARVGRSTEYSISYFLDSYNLSTHTKGKWFLRCDKKTAKPPPFKGFYSFISNTHFKHFVLQQLICESAAGDGMNPPHTDETPHEDQTDMQCA
ncbi:MAG: hypothetical protein AAGD92_10295 [Pseudomonadota bacterium]